MMLFKEIEKREKEKVRGERIKSIAKSKWRVECSRELIGLESSISYDNLRKGEKRENG